jgi:hypothetical protein
MSNQKISNEVIAAIIAGLFGLVATNWDKFFPPSSSLTPAQGE